MEPKIIIHGGFFSESATNHDMKATKQLALSQIVEKGYHYLKSHTALETVNYTVSLLEDCELFNAGLGSQIQNDGNIRLSASIMDGLSKKFGGVINIQEVKNPVQIAYRLLDYPDSVLSDHGALHFARENGFQYFNPETAARRADFEKRLHDQSRLGTVGCVALDSNGHLAVATSTGGKGFEIPCRVSDSATVAGNYATESAAVSCTGVGENIVSGAIAAKIVTRVTDGFSLEDANRKTFEELKAFDGFAGAISIDAKGNIYHTDSHPYMVWALVDNGIHVFN